MGNVPRFGDADQASDERAVVISWHPGGHDTSTCEGIPDLAGTRFLCFGGAIPCAVFAIWLPLAGFARIREVDNAGLVLFLILAAAALSVGLAIGLVRAGMRAGAWFRVTPEGVSYGSGAAGSGTIQARGDSGFDWKRIVRNPERAYDIGIASEVYRVAPNPRMTFWYREEDDSVVERSLPLQLRDNALQCLRFRNAHQVRVAFLRRLAAIPDLRFDPDVFVCAGIDPETWAPMPGPRRASWLAVWLTMACILGFAALGDGKWSAGRLAIGTALIFAGGLLLYMRYWPRAYPRLTEIITFRPTS